MSLELEVSHARGGFALEARLTLDGTAITSLFGPSGAGKSTLLALIAGLERPRAGRIRLDGTVLSDSARGIHLPPQRRRLGMVFQEGRLFPHLSVRANLDYGRRRRGARLALDPVVHLLELTPLLDRAPATLSGGERQRVALGRALLSDPALLLLDEPLAALDAALKAQILPALEQLRAERRLPMLHVSHDPVEVGRLADRVVLIKGGRLVADGPIAALAPRLSPADPFSVIAGRLVDHDPAGGVSRLAFDGGVLVVPRVALPPGAPLRALVQAREVLLAPGPPSALPPLSALNLLPATLCTLQPAGDQVEATLALGPTRLLARLTRRSAGALGLAPGAAVTAIIKAVTLGGREGTAPSDPPAPDRPR